MMTIVENFFTMLRSKKLVFPLLLLCILAMYLLLAFKSPFSERTLVPNLEPYPDTLYYSVPTWNLLHDKGLRMTINDVSVPPATPPLYTLALIPFFALFQDVRAFYLLNILFGIISVVFVLRTLKALFPLVTIFNVFVVGITGFFFVTTFYIYNLPQLLMAENISLALMSMSIYYLNTLPEWILKKHSTFIAFGIGLLSTTFVWIKLSNVPISLIITLSYMIMMWFRDKRFLKPYILGLLISGISFYWFLQTSQMLVDHKNLQGSDFMIERIPEGLAFYTRSLLGLTQTSFLWFFEKLTNPVVSLLILVGLIVSIKDNAMKSLSITAVTLTIGLLVFMSSFYARDVRYVLILWPVLILFVAKGLNVLKNQSTLIKSVICALLIGVYLLYAPFGYRPGESNVVTFKKQIGLNLRYAETPWNYKTANHINDFLNTLDTSTQITYIASFLPPSYLDLYVQKDVTFLPISETQEFFWLYPQLQEKYIGKGIAETYAQLLQDDAHVYILRYYETNRADVWPMEYNEITSKFELKKVSEGCDGICDIYELHLLQRVVE